jgi:hypothetical protein
MDAPHGAMVDAMMKDPAMIKQMLEATGHGDVARSCNTVAKLQAAFQGLMMGGASAGGGSSDGMPGLFDFVDMPEEVFQTFDSAKWIDELRVARASIGGPLPLEICDICCDNPLTQKNQMRMYCCGQVHCKICLFSSGELQHRCAFCRKPWPKSVKEARALLGKHANEAWAKYEMATQVWPQGHMPFVGSRSKMAALLRDAAEAGFAPAQSKLAGLEYQQGLNETAETIAGRDEAQRLLVLSAASGDPESCFELFKFVVLHASPVVSTARCAPRQPGHRDASVYKHPAVSLYGLALLFITDTVDGVGMPVCAAKEAMALLRFSAERHYVGANEILLNIYDICQKRGDPLGVAPTSADVPALSTQLDRAVLLHRGEVVYSCQCCKRETDEWSVCGRCKRVKYCSKQCQRADWRQHKSQCLPKPESKPVAKTKSGNMP